MKGKTTYFLLPILIFLLACSDVKINTPDFYKGEIIVYSASCEFDTVCYTLKDDYGIRVEAEQFLFWERNQLFLYMNNEQKVISSYNAKALARELEKLPENSIIGHYKTCASISLDIKSWETVAAAMEKRKLKLVGFPEVPHTLMCTCGICP